MVDHIGPTVDAVFVRRVQVVGSQVVMDVTMPFSTILSTS
jgi:hypothetical protein